MSDECDVIVKQRPKKKTIAFRHLDFLQLCSNYEPFLKLLDP